MDKSVRLRSISKKYPSSLEDFWALESVTFDAGPGESLGMIGRNGAGKTTLLNIIAGVLSATKGEIITGGRVLGLFNLGVGFQDELTGRENIFLNGALLGATKKELESKLDPIIGFSELGNFINMPLGSYSQGMRLRLGFSIVANLDFDILVIDEVLAVGDVLFQSKCFERLMDFKRAGKTLIITTQSMDLIERLCDRTLLLDHGRLLFCGDNQEAINRYRMLLNTEKFFVGSAKINAALVENTKKWADDISEWGSKLGTKETEIDTVEFINKWGLKCDNIKSREPLKIRVHFFAKNRIREPHFGVAIFREDGVYCYGPNTAFDGCRIREINPGKGWFELQYKEFLLAPGKYKVSVAIWDKFETLAYDYHNGYYDLTVKGKDHGAKDLLNIPFKAKKNILDFPARDRAAIRLCDMLNKVKPQNIENEQVRISSIDLMDNRLKLQDVFKTNESACFRVNMANTMASCRGHYLWLGLFRDDDVHCQGFAFPLNGKRDYDIYFAGLPLLPGGYRIDSGVWDNKARDFLVFQRNACVFRMVFNRQDHGTVYLQHKWKWGLL